MTTGEKVRMWRTKRGLSQTALGQRIGMHRASVSTYENDWRGWPLDTVLLFARGIGCSGLDLINDDLLDGLKNPYPWEE